MPAGLLRGGYLAARALECKSQLALLLTNSLYCDVSLFGSARVRAILSCKIARTLAGVPILSATTKSSLDAASMSGLSANFVVRQLMVVFVCQAGHFLSKVTRL
mmetsp:Transcript_32213/g.96920  ORF Transcript_32213/g.96920 Transcript_32213/m.96920 type:complete len:104 (-) Transcript_32213:552-863(-)